MSQTDQYPGCCSPNAVARVGYDVELVADRADHQAVATVIDGVEDERERHFEDLCHLVPVDGQLSEFLDPADERIDPETGDGGVRRQATQEFHPFRRKADLLEGLAQSGFRRARVTCLYPASGKADLSRVVAQMLGPPGKDDGRSLPARDQPHQDRRRHPQVRRRPFLLNHTASALKPEPQPMSIYLSTVQHTRSTSRRLTARAPSALKDTRTGPEPAPLAPSCPRR